MGHAVEIKRMPTPDNQYLFSGIIFVFEVIVLVAYLLGTDYEADPVALVRYPMYQDVNSMIFLGFGFLMCFLARYAWTSLGMTFLLSAMAIQASILINHCIHDIVAGVAIEEIKLSVESLITGDFAAGAILISFGAVLGRASPTQLLVMMIMELVVYAINESIGVVEFKAIDVGGSMYVHAFGAFFGIGVSWMLGSADALSGRRPGDSAAAVSVEAAVAADTTTRGASAAAPAAGGASSSPPADEASTSKSASSLAMLGTLVLWMFWPSFNGALASGAAQQRVVVNTVLSIAASCIAAFMSSRILRGGKLSMEDIQNATLAGGVAIGSAADLLVGPGAAIAVGFLAGCVSVAGYVYLTPFLSSSLGIDDTCGVINLHGIPGVIGGLAGSISAAVATSSRYGDELTELWGARSLRSSGEQAAYQAAALGLTVGLALVGGALTGAVIRLPVFGPVVPPPMNSGSESNHVGPGLYEDERNWDFEEVADASKGHPASPYL